MTGIAISQSSNINQIENYINIKNWAKADSVYYTLIKKEKSKNQIIKLKYYKGVILFNYGFYDKALDFFYESKIYYEKGNDQKDLALTLGYIIECINYLTNKEEHLQEKDNQIIYINSFCDLANKLKDYNLNCDCEYYRGTYALNSNDFQSCIIHYKNINRIALRNNDSTKYYNNQINIGWHIGYSQKRHRESIELLNKSITYFSKNKDSDRLFSSMLNLSYQYYFLDSVQKTIKILHDIDTIKIKSDMLDSKSTIYSFLSESYKYEKKYEASLKYLELTNKYEDSLKKGRQLIQYRMLKEELNNQELKTNNQELRADNLETEANNKRSQAIATGLGGSLFLGSIIAFLVYRNTKRKQHIAEQDRELQIQKTETILKEKEIETINAIVSGQEKERLRLAGELHDNLGSTLATVRMQVENLERNLEKVEDPKELLKETNMLVNEAYDKVRKISHERNSGVMAKDGLLPAVQKLARTVSNANSLTVDVQDFGLENRIANELEITIFRIIQELVTNIVKHANATEASISLTQHDNELNIMVEDNGKGFKTGRLKEKEGMGLGNIERRIEHLEGSMEVDSNPGRGTSISIDIPL